MRAVATNTVRQLRSPQRFLLPAETALGMRIEVVSGREEARLIYLGVAHAQPPKDGQRRLVIDIGGGSTEFIIGRGFEPLERESLQIGCVASTRRFFPNGKLSRKRWKDALTEITAEFQQFASTYRSLGWDEAIGSSGTNKAIGEICAALKLTKGAITAEALPLVRERLLQADRIEDIDLPGLSADRRPIIAGGVLVLEAVFAALGLQRMQVSKGAMREGVLYDLLGRGGADDPREASVDALMRPLRHRRRAGRAGRGHRAAPVRPGRGQLGAGCRRPPHAVARRAPARDRPGHRPQRLPRAWRLHARTLRHRRFLAAGAAGAGRAGAHPPPRHPQAGVRADPRPPAGERAAHAPPCCGSRCCCIARTTASRCPNSSSATARSRPR